MTRLKDGLFETALTGTDGYTTVTGAPTLDTTSRIKGVNSALHSWSAATCFGTVSSLSAAELFVSFYIYITALPTVASIRLNNFSNGASQLSLVLTTTGTLQLRNGSTVLFTSSALSINTLYRIGLHQKVSTAIGNADSVIEGWFAVGDAAFGSAFGTSSAQLMTTSNANFTSVTFGNTNSASGVGTLYIDNIRIDDTTMPGPDSGSVQVDTVYTAAAPLVAVKVTAYTASAVLSALKQTDHTAAAVLASTSVTAFTAAAVLAKTSVITFTGATVLTGPVVTQYTAAAVLQGGVTVGYTSAAVLAKMSEVGYSAAAVLSLILHPETAYTASAALSGPITIAYTAATVLIPPVVVKYYPWLQTNPWSETTFWLCDQVGNVVAILEPSYYISASYQLGLNSVTTLQVQLPGDFPYNNIVRDGWIFPVRHIAGRAPYLDGNSIFLVSERSKMLSEGGQRFVGLKAQSGLTLAGRRIVDFDTETSQSDKTGAADDLLLAYFRENYGALATTVRNASSYLTIPGNNTLAPSTVYSGSRKSLIQVAQDLGTVSGNAAVPLYYDILLDNISFKKLTLRTWIGSRGVNRTLVGGASEVLLSTETGSLGNVILTEDWSSAWNFVYATGKGQTGQRIVKTAEDTGLSLQGPFSRVETQVNANAAQTGAQVQSLADATLRKGQPLKVFQADVMDSSLYGRSIFIGDVIFGELDGSVFSLMLSGVSVQCGSGPDKVKVLLKATE